MTDSGSGHTAVSFDAQEPIDAAGPCPTMDTGVRR